jgi:hypothetical protein
MKLGAILTTHVVCFVPSSRGDAGGGDRAFVSGTGLVRAATTLPGDNLYPVKRTWEDVLVLLT